MKLVDDLRVSDVARIRELFHQHPYIFVGSRLYLYDGMLHHILEIGKAIRQKLGFLPGSSSGPRFVHSTKQNSGLKDNHFIFIRHKVMKSITYKHILLFPGRMLLKLGTHVFIDIHVIEHFPNAFYRK